MKTKYLIALALLSVAACNRKREPNKLIDGIPVNPTATAAPAQAAQEYLLLHRDLMTVAIPVINKLILADSDFSELSPQGGGVYTFHREESHYGSAQFSLSFRDGTGASIDPIATRTSSTTFKTMVISFSGTSSLFSYNENATLTLDVEGAVDSAKRVATSTDFTGLGDAYGVTMAFQTVSPGAVGIFQGLSGGQVTVTGSDLTADPITMTFNFASDRKIDGTLAWEGKEGVLHIDVAGPGYVVTSQERILLD